MPDGITHEKYRQRMRIVFYPLAPVVPILITSLIELRDYSGLFIGIGIILGYEFGRYVTPDADQMGTTAPEGWMVNELWILGYYLFGILSVYGAMFRRYHRHFITHVPFISTFIRYFFLFFREWYMIYTSTKDLYWLIFLFLGMYIGTSFSDSVHWFLDFIGFPKSE